MTCIVGKLVIFLFRYCKTLNICGIKLLWSNENELLAYFNFGVHDGLIKLIKFTFIREINNFISVSIAKQTSYSTSCGSNLNEL